MLALPRRLLVLSALLAATALPACTGNSVSPDGGDARADGSADATVSDVPTGPSCGGPRPEDLVALAQQQPDGLHYTGSNADAPPDLSANLQPPYNGSCGFFAVNERLFSYTMRTTAALRASTDNPGTDMGFDTVLFVVPDPCIDPPQVLSCADDDPLAPAASHVVASLTTTPVLPAGTRVLIAVAGFYPSPDSDQAPDPSTQTGTFELTVREIAPVAPDAACDPTGATTVCPLAATCVSDGIGAATGHCHANGAAPGTSCVAADGGAACAAPLACDAQNNACYSTVAVGAGCDLVGVARERCGADATCVSYVRGAARGVCRANGTYAQTPCADVVCTGLGLRCVQNPAGMTGGTCLIQTPPGGACTVGLSACITGQTCRPASPGATAGTCVNTGSAPGTACRAEVSECDDPLFCISSSPSSTDRVCKTVGHNAGDPCGTWGACSFTMACVTPDPSDPLHGVCTPPGGAGAPCSAGHCDAGLTCTNPMSQTQSRCLRMAAVGEPCDTGARLSRCAAGSTCVRDGSTGTSGTCQTNGTAAGAACASGAMCGSGLACAADGSRCQRVADASGACDPRFATVQCPAGQACRASAREGGQCAATVAEAEPNEPVPAATAVDVPVAVAGSLARYDVDCVGLDVPAGGGVYAQVTAPSGACTDKLALDVYAPTGLPLGTDTTSGPFSCPRVDGADGNFPWAHGLGAGRYTVCVREASDRRPVAAYVLSANVVAP